MDLLEDLRKTAAQTQNTYLAEHINQMILDGKTTKVDVTYEIAEFIKLKQSDNILDKGLGWSCSDILLYMIERAEKSINKP